MNNMFEPREAEAICSLPVSKLGHSDVLVWHYEKKGMYIVKNAYRMLRQSLEMEPGTELEDENVKWRKV